MPATLHEPPSQNSIHFLFYKTLNPRLPPSSTILFPLKMASNNNSFILLFLNLLFYALISSHSIPCPPSISKPQPKPKHRHHHHWPSDALKLGVCANVLGGLRNINLGQPPKKPCCSLIEGLADLEAAVCLCTAIKAEVLGINLNVPVSLSLLLNNFGKKLPAGFQCA